MNVFEDAVRALLGAPPEAVVSCEISGGQDYQIGDYTWDTEPTEIEVSASVGDYVAGTHQRWSLKFDTIPELFNAMIAAELGR